MTAPETPKDVRKLAKDRADWMLDAVSTATQDPRYLPGTPEYDAVAGAAILMNAEKVLVAAIMADRLVRPASPATDVETGIKPFGWLHRVRGFKTWSFVDDEYYANGCRLLGQDVFAVYTKLPE